VEQFMRQTLILSVIASCLVQTGEASAATLVSNGTIVTNPAAGAGGFNVSQASEDFNTLGFLSAAPARLADDFTVGGPLGWNVDRLTVSAYVIGSYTVPPAWSPVSGLTATLWRGAPEEPGSDPIASSTTLSANAFSGTFRVGHGAANFQNTDRPVFDLSVDFPGTFLAPGDYWIDYSVSGGNAFSPMVMSAGGLNPVTFDGNARRKLTPGGSWVTLIGGVTTQGVDFPFVIEGSLAVPEPMCAGLLGVWMMLHRARRRIPAVGASNA